MASEWVSNTPHEARLRERVAELEAERGRLWALVLRGRECRQLANDLIKLQKQHIAELERDRDTWKGMAESYHQAFEEARWRMSW